jgi:hypothetical protein
MIALSVPNYQQLGEVSRWYLPLPNRDDEDGDMEYYRTVARFVGFGTSWTDNHWGHRERFVPRGNRCNACRWFEIRIFRELDIEPTDVAPNADLERQFRDAERAGELGDYVVYKAGMSIVPDEIPYVRYDKISSPFEVVEALTTRRHTDSGPQAFITKPSAMALASGARFDVELADAYVNRAVS